MGEETTLRNSNHEKNIIKYRSLINNGRSLYVLLITICILSDLVNVLLM